MLYFLFVPLWLLCVIIALILLIPRRTRFLSLYILLGATAVCLFSFLGGMAPLFILGKVYELIGPEFSWILAVPMWLLGTGCGALVGAFISFLAARRLNRAIGWSSGGKI
jgi:hypothetical protein